jgi:toxin-antitoxin system PIN domain toxin
MRALLDVNVLVALFDLEHVHHRPARRWWAEDCDGGWASCPLTQNGFVRVLSGAHYARSFPFVDAVRLLDAQMKEPGHVGWPDDLSITDEAIFAHSRIQGPNQITDIYLLALAVKNSGRLVTFDRSIPLAAVRSAEARHLTVIATS